MSVCRTTDCCKPDDFNFHSDAATFADSQNCRVANIATGLLPDGEIDQPYSTVLQGVGGVMPYAFTVVAGSLPNGLTLNPNGTISGTPTESGDFTVEVLMTDSLT